MILNLQTCEMLSSDKRVNNLNALQQTVLKYSRKKAWWWKQVLGYFGVYPAVRTKPGLYLECFLLCGRHSYSFINLSRIVSRQSCTLATLLSNFLTFRPTQPFLSHLQRRWACLQTGIWPPGFLVQPEQLNAQKTVEMVANFKRSPTPRGILRFSREMSC